MSNASTGPDYTTSELDPREFRITGPGKFSRTEIRDITISIIVLSAAFMLMYRNTNFVTVFFKHYMGDAWIVGMFLLMAALVTLSFMLHEMGHKFTAQKLGLWSEYRMFPMGLLIALAMSCVGFLFAAPGVVYINGYVTREDDGKISVAGPAVNIVLAIVGLVGCLALNGNPAIIFFYLLFTLNASLAVFNLLPIGILDGSKILRWNSGIWIACFVIAAVLFVSRIIGLVPDFYYSF